MTDTDQAMNRNEELLVMLGWRIKTWTRESSPCSTASQYNQELSCYETRLRAVIPPESKLLLIAKADALLASVEWDGLPLSWQEWIDRVDWHWPAPYDCLGEALNLREPDEEIQITIADNWAKCQYALVVDRRSNGDHLVKIVEARAEDITEAVANALWNGAEEKVKHREEQADERHVAHIG